MTLFMFMNLCLCIMSCVFVLSFKFLLCSPLCLPLSVVLFPSMFLLCAPPLPIYHTWPPPSSLLPPLSSPVPHLIIRVCVISLCFPFTPCLVIVSVCLCLHPLMDLFMPHSMSAHACFCFLPLVWTLLFALHFVVLLFSWYFLSSPFCLLLFFCIQL